MHPGKEPMSVLCYAESPEDTRVAPVLILTLSFPSPSRGIPEEIFAADSVPSGGNLWNYFLF